MLKVLSSAALVTGLLSLTTTAMAMHTVTLSHDLIANVHMTCMVPGQATPSSDANNVATWDAGYNTLDFTPAVDPATAQIANGASGSVTYDRGVVKCNFKSSFSIESANGGMTLNGPNPIGNGSNFANVINYKAQVAYCTKTATIEFNGGPTTNSSGLPNYNSNVCPLNRSNNDLMISYELKNNGTQMLIAGSYSDTVTVKVGANI